MKQRQSCRMESKKVKLKEKLIPSLNYWKNRMAQYFGTDGFRGEANVSLTALHAYQIGRFLGWYDEPIIGNLHAVDFEKMVATAKVVPDGDWHEYAIALDKVRGWWGSVNELWFEAVNVRAANVEIDWMRFE